MSPTQLRNGQLWRASLTGKRTLNAVPVRFAWDGHVDKCTDSANVWDLAQSILQLLRARSTEMEYPHSITLEILPPSDPSDPSAPSEGSEI